MDSGFYAVCAALMARSQALDLVADNLANTSSPGYRRQHNIFRSFLATAAGHLGSGLNQAVNDF
jgi:flagellar basal-body rod protein FlgF